MPSQFSRRSLLAGTGAAAFAGLSMTQAPPSFAATTGNSTDEPGILSSSSLLDPKHSLAAGTVFRRDVRNMPVDPNSQALIESFMAIPQEIGASHGISTSPNTQSYNVPIYLVDSSVPNCHTMNFSAAGYGFSPDPLILGKIPCPSWAGPGWGRDQEMAVYDTATGIMREYYGVVPDGTGAGFKVTYGGYSRQAPGFTDLASKNFPLQLSQGSASVVKMHSAIGQISLQGLLRGTINGAIPFTMPDASAGYSWPALQGDGMWKGSPTLVEGQWVRFRQDIDVDALGLTHMTRLVARAMQRFGGVGIDRNDFDAAINFESYFGWGKNASSPWSAINTAFANTTTGGDPYLDDFPWQYVEAAPRDWKGTAIAPDLPEPTPYVASDWHFFATGHFATSVKANIAKFSLISSTDVTSGVGHVMYTKTYSLGSTGAVYEFPIIVNPHSVHQTVTAYVNNSPVATASSNGPSGSRALKFAMPAGRSTLRIQFDIPAGSNVDQVWVWSPTIH